MVTITCTEKTARDYLDYCNEFIDHANSVKFRNEAERNKLPIKRALGRIEGIPIKHLDSFRLAIKNN